MKLTLHRYELPTRHPFTISRGTTTVQRTLIVDLEQDGVHGYGEAPEAAYYGAAIETMTEITGTREFDDRLLHRVGERRSARP